MDMAKRGGEGVSETISIEDVDELFINDEILIDGEYLKFIMQMDASDMQCPECGQQNKDNKMFQLDNGQYLYIGNCCGRFVLCEVNGEDNGMATDE
tara:strand:+ start:1132 stop:1419 length:288 start_codon:yes stop_codon:yes gene_type:complete